MRHELYYRSNTGRKIDTLHRAKFERAFCSLVLASCLVSSLRVRSTTEPHLCHISGTEHKCAPHRQWRRAVRPHATVRLAFT